MNLDNFVIDKDFLLDVHNNTIYNKTIIDYYKLYLIDVVPHKKHIIKNTIDNIGCCNKFFEIDKYTFNMIKDFRRTNLCKNKFCNNCKKVKQACRMSRYIPELEQYSDNLYHLTLTLPNVHDNDLKLTLKKMRLAFRNIILYLNGNLKSKGFDFKKLGYQGCVRSLEITFKDDFYHPHYHCCVSFKNLVLDKKYTNQYSYDYLGVRETKLFSEFEILIQKMWYMFLNDIKFTKDNFDSLDLGYSCNCDKFKPGDYAELFKYMTKSTDEKENILSYSNFKTLLESTYCLKQIQGYGCFYNICDDDIDDEIEKVYCNIKSYLTSYEKPILSFESPKSLIDDNNYKLISRQKIFQYLNSDEVKNKRLDDFAEMQKLYGCVIYEK